MDENGFQGTIPPCFGDLQQLRQLYVFKNQLTGELPRELTELSWLSKFLLIKDHQTVHANRVSPPFVAILVASYSWPRVGRERFQGVCSSGDLLNQEQRR